MLFDIICTYFTQCKWQHKCLNTFFPYSNVYVQEISKMWWEHSLTYAKNMHFLWQHNVLCAVWSAFNSPLPLCASMHISLYRFSMSNTFLSPVSLRHKIWCSVCDEWELQQVFTHRTALSVIYQHLSCGFFRLDAMFTTRTCCSVCDGYSSASAYWKAG